MRLKSKDIANALGLTTVENGREEIRMSKTDRDAYVIYVPSNTNVILGDDLTGYDIKVIDMEKKNIAYPKIRVNDNRTLIEMHRFDKDVLVIAKK